MFYLSNRKLRLLIITLLLFIFCFFLGLFNAKAMPVTDFSIIQNYNSNSQCVYTTTGSNSGNETIRSPLYGNGRCTLSNSITPDADYLIIPIIMVASESIDNSYGYSVNFINESVQIWLNTLGGDIPCDYDGTYATCPFRLANAQRLTNINFLYAHGGGLPNSYYIRVANDWLVANGKNNNNAINNIQNNTNNINNSINDSSIDGNGATSSASDWNSKNASNGTITNLLTLPITLLQAIVNGLQSSCSSFSLGTLFGTSISLPCISVGNLIGNGLWTTVDILFSGFMILAIAKKLIKIFNDFTNLKSNQIDELYGGVNK